MGSIHSLEYRLQKTIKKRRVKKHHSVSKGLEPSRVVIGGLQSILVLSVSIGCCLKKNSLRGENSCVSLYNIPLTE